MGTVPSVLNIGESRSFSLIPLRKTWRVKEKCLSLQTRTINVTTMKTSYCHKTSLNDSIRVYAIILFLLCFNLAISAQVKSAEQDSLNIPVILIDGVEVQNLDSIDIVNFKDDVIDIKVIKDRKITELFAPRLGGVMCITTKSKKYLTPIIQKYEENVEAAKKKRKPNTIYIR